MICVFKRMMTDVVLIYFMLNNVGVVHILHEEGFLHIRKDSSYICIYVHMKSSFPKHVKRRSRKWVCNASSKVVFWSRVSFTCVHDYEKLFSKTWSPNLAFGLQHRFLDWRLTYFGKDLFVCTNIQIYEESFLFQNTISAI